MANTQICWDCLSTAAFHHVPIIYSWVITWTEENNRSKPSVCCWLTKSNIRKISSCCVAITSAPVLTEFMVGIIALICSKTVHTNLTLILGFYDECKRRYNIKLWKTFTDCFNCLPIAAIIDEKIFCCHGGLSPDLQNMDQIRRIMRPTDVPDTGLLCDLLWSDPDKDVNVCEFDRGHNVRCFWYHSKVFFIVFQGWGENDRGVSFTFGADIVSKFLNRHDLDLICRAHQVLIINIRFHLKLLLIMLCFFS